MQALRRTDDGTVEADPLVPVQMQLSIDMDINSLPPGSPERDAFELRCEPRTRAAHSRLGCARAHEIVAGKGTDNTHPPCGPAAMAAARHSPRATKVA